MAISNHAAMLAAAHKMIREDYLFCSKEMAKAGYSGCLQHLRERMRLIGADQYRLDGVNPVRGNARISGLDNG